MSWWSHSSKELSRRKTKPSMALEKWATDFHWVWAKRGRNTIRKASQPWSSMSFGLQRLLTRHLVMRSLDNKWLSSPSLMSTRNMELSWMNALRFLNLSIKVRLCSTSELKSRKILKSKTLVSTWAKRSVLRGRSADLRSRNWKKL